MPSYKVMVARFPYGDSDCAECVDWLIANTHKIRTDPRVSEFIGWKRADTPITASRNAALKFAIENKIDYCLMVDSDMVPDLPYPSAKPFWESSWEFVLQHRDRPCVICSPYCGPPPQELPYIFTWRTQQSDHSNADYSLQMLTREEAAIRGGIEEVAAIPTGLVLIDVRSCDYLTPPYFDYEWSDPPYNSQKASTEDVYWSRNLSLAGVPLYCNWDAWSGHKKSKIVGKPDLITVDDMKSSFRDAILRNHKSNERLYDIGAGKNGRNGRPRFESLHRVQNSKAEVL